MKYSDLSLKKNNIPSKHKLFVRRVYTNGLQPAAPEPRVTLSPLHWVSKNKSFSF